MKYMGSKTRISKHILPLMLKHRAHRWWVEPFVGGGNMIDKVIGHRIGGDSNPYVIDALKTIRDDIARIPKNNSEFTEDDYRKLKDGDYEFKGFAGFAYSYAGKWMGGWCRDKAGKRDYVAEAYRNAVKQSKKLQGVEFVCVDYDKLTIPPRSVIYCDPPYANTTGYSSEFDDVRFWQWAREMSEIGHIVYVSEYSAPDDFKCIWSMEICNTLVQNTGSKKGKECLFVRGI